MPEVSGTSLTLSSTIQPCHYNFTCLAHPALLTTTTSFPSTAAKVWLEPTEPLFVDVVSFQDVLARVETAVAITPDQVAQLTEAVSHYQVDFLAGFNLSDCHAFEEWQLTQATELRHTLAAGLVTLIGWHQQQTEFEPALHFARRWLELDSLHEAAHRKLMTLYAQAGQQAAALRQYEACVRLLADELGVEPEVETAELYRAIKDRKLAPVMCPVTTAETAGPVHHFPAPTTPLIGREAEKQVLLDDLCAEATRLVTIQG